LSPESGRAGKWVVAIGPKQPYTGIVSEPDIQIASNHAGQPAAVIVPIALWREITSERETVYLPTSETMKQRLMAAAQRQDGFSWEAVVEKPGL
jgi:PHD/YefM family antitoxin component YafN of YafNO toxin-antitoxin module